MEERVKQLESEVQELKDFIKLLQADTTIPFDVEGAFRKRLEDLALAVTTSSKSAGSENQAVNEAGMATYSVLGTPTGWLEIVLDNTTYYIPYFSA